MKHPLISVITVVYNDHVHIEQTIISVLNQTYDNMEYIIIDGGSKDGTMEIILRYKKQLSKFISEPDKGIYDAMNKGIMVSSGKWLIFMNSGDCFVNNTVLEDIFKYEIPTRCKLIYGDVLLNYGQGKTVVRKLNNIRKDLLPFYLCHQSTLTDGLYLRKHLYDINYKICADANSFYNIQKSGFTLKYVDVPISIYEAYEGMSSKNSYKSFLEQSKIRGINYCSWNFIYNYIKIIIKLFISNVLPQKSYSKLMIWYTSINNR